MGVTLRLSDSEAWTNETKLFLRMELVDMVITQIWLSGRTSRSVHIFFPAAAFGSSMGFHPLGQSSRKSKPPTGADFSILPSGYYYAI